MDPQIAQRISAAAQTIEHTKKQMERTQDRELWNQLDAQLQQAENELAQCNIALRNEAGPG